jgi:hypothetical protein
VTPHNTRRMGFRVLRKRSNGPVRRRGLSVRTEFPFALSLTGFTLPKQKGEL